MESLSPKYILIYLEILAGATEEILKNHKWSKEVERTRRNQVLAKREEQAREKLERKLMKQ